MEYLTKIIEQASREIGSQKELEAYLGLAKGYLANVKGGRCGLPDIAQDKLEKLMHLEGGALRAPSAIITEKAPEKVAYWKKKLIELETVTMAVVFSSVILLMTPTPSEANEYGKSLIIIMYIM